MEASARVLIQLFNLALTGINPLHFMPGISYHCTFLRKSLQRMSRNEPGGLDVVFCEQLQETADSNRTGKETLQQSAYDSARMSGTCTPLDMSLVESSPPYEPSHPATASMSTDMQQSASTIVSGQDTH